MDKTIKARVQHKHDIEANWLKATNFIPKEGEIIIYDADATHTYTRIKIGDGVQNVNDLPFVDDHIFEEINQKSQVQIVTWEADD